MFDDLFSVSAQPDCLHLNPPAAVNPTRLLHSSKTNQTPFNGAEVCFTSPSHTLTLTLSSHAFYSVWRPQSFSSTRLQAEASALQRLVYSVLTVYWGLQSKPDNPALQSCNQRLFPLSINPLRSIKDRNQWGMPILVSKLQGWHL